jgi:hypothetical protein
VQDVHNLCWKLALVLQGRAADLLLQTYHDERQPLARTITEQALANAVSMGRLQKVQKTTGARPEFLNEQGMIFGASYTSSAVVPDGSPPTAVANPITDYVASARPGGRAPHAWLQAKDGMRVSTIDLVGKGFTLLAGAKAADWTEAAKALEVTSVAVGNGSLQPADERWREAYGIGDDGAVLVRPDGYVAWRSASGVADPARTLAGAMNAIQGRPS